MLDPRTNTTIEELAQALSRHSSFAITGHVNPDGDCLGSQLTLALALRSMGKRADVLLVEDAPVEEGLRFLPGFDTLVPAQHYMGTPEAFISVDVSVRDRIKASADVMDRCGAVYVLDHHAGPDIAADLLYDDPGAASCTMLAWDVVKALGVQPDADMAQCAYTGLMTDTGRFQFQNADADAFEHAAQMVAAGARPSEAAREFFQNRSVASLRLQQRMVDNLEMLADGACAFSYLSLDDFAVCNAVNSDAESLIDVLRGIRGVRMACLLKERDGFVRGSLRAKDDVLDVAAAARALGGGGHKAAAGFTLDMGLPQAMQAAKAQIAQVLEA